MTEQIQKLKLRATSERQKLLVVKIICRVGGFQQYYRWGHFSNPYSNIHNYPPKFSFPQL